MYEQFDKHLGGLWEPSKIHYLLSPHPWHSYKGLTPCLRAVTSAVKVVDASVELILGSLLELTVLLAAVLLLPREMATIKVETHAKGNNMEPKKSSSRWLYPKKTALLKVLILNKFSKGKSMEYSKEALKKWLLIPKNLKNMVVPFHSDHLWVSQDVHLVITDDLNEH